MILSILVSTLVLSSLQANHKLILLNSINEAKCLDGSSPGFYYSKGFGSGVDKMVIYFEPGGFC